MNIWDNSNGLPQNTIYALEKDNHGYLWTATEEGLVRLDGTNAKVFDQETNPLMIEQTYYTFFKTEEGIWASADRSIALLEKNIIKVIDCHEIADKTWIRAISKNQKGELLIGTQTGKIHTWKNGTFGTLDFWQPDFPLEIFSFYSLSPSKLLVGTTRGLYELDMIAEKSQLISSDSFVVQKVFGNADFLLISNPNEGIYRLKEDYEMELIVSYREYPDINSTSLTIDSKNKIWAGSMEKGILSIDNGKISRYIYPELKNYIVRKIIKEDNIIYLGTLGKGVAVVKDAKVKQLNFDVLHEKNIKPIFQAQDSSIWIGTMADGLHRIKGQTIHSLTTRDGLIQNRVTTIGASKGKIYAGSSTGISVIDQKSGKVINTITSKDGLKSHYVQAIYEDSKGWLWILTRHGGMHYYDTAGILHSVELPAEFDRTSFISILELKNKQIIIGTLNGGIFRIENGKFLNNQKLPLTPGEDVVYDIHEDKSGDLWFATHGGILFNSKGEFNSIKKPNGLKSKSVYSITEDPVDGIWISNNFGVQYFSDSELENFKNNPEQDFFLASTLYNQEMGMPNSESNGLIFPAAMLDYSGKIWVPTVEGVGIIDPISLSTIPKNPINFIWDELSVGDQITAIENQILIPAGIRMFQVSFSLIEFENPSQYSLFYRIGKNSGPWIPIDNQRQLNFNGWKPGKYELEIIMLRNGQLEMNQTIPIKVEATFFETPYFWTLIALAIILLAYFIFQHYFNSKMKKDLEAKVAKRTLELSYSNKKLKIAVNEIEDQNLILKEITWNQSHLVRAPLTKAMGINQLLINYPKYTNVGKSKEQLELELLDALKQLDKIVKETHYMSENLQKK
ncbi:ligand-binding sensor domain-containing protein [Algoriphagus yeomjeoni]|uniref:Ligand-binding sensor domain-containing protein n=1 Tax=Algoriphagus yeomjeoni TaxID=291403 RepID=A0A327PH32_9BACT|nr:two-component regulator propeller domain-containing protein [Algoriphagus yeomjeoni]RAI91590.1 ligand-binding sensor domain-containing protein [Algoriphagus yeomjeoni]